MPGKMGYQEMCALGAASGSLTVPVEFDDFKIVITPQVHDANGIRGILGKQVENAPTWGSSVEGPITFQPGHSALAFALQYGLGVAPSSGVYALGETLPTFAASKKDGTTRWLYEGLATNNFTIEAKQGGGITVTLDTMGCVGTHTGTHPSLTLPNEAPFVFSTATFKLAGSDYPMSMYKLSIGYSLERQWFNSPTPTRHNATERNVMVTADVPWGDISPMYGSTDNCAVVSSFTNGSKTLTLTTPAVKLTQPSPTSNARGEIIWTMTGPAMRTGSTAELSISLL